MRNVIRYACCCLLMLIAACDAQSGKESRELEQVEQGSPLRDSPPGTLLFRSGFEGDVTLSEARDCFDIGCWRYLEGTDTEAGFSFPPVALSDKAAMQLLVDEPVTASSINEFIVNEFRTIVGHDGTESRALYSEITKSGCCGTNPQDGGATQNSLQLQPDGSPGDLYISYWLKFQPNLAELMADETWRAFFNIKTGNPGQGDGDFRIAAYVRTDQGLDNLHWSCEGDNGGGGDFPLINNWVIGNDSVPVPIDEWFKYEVFLHRSAAADGRVWMAVDGELICDRAGANTGAGGLPINRIMMPTLYSGSAYPIYQWVDDIQIWNGFPTTQGDPPYAPH